MTIFELNQKLSSFLKPFFVWFSVGIQKRSVVLAFLCGAGPALAHPPFSLMIGLLGLSLFLLIIHNETNSIRAFGLGFAAGLAYFLISVFWVAEAFLVDTETYGWMAPFAVVLLASIPALFWGLASSLYVRLKSDVTVQPWLWAGIFTLMEMMRGMAFTGFPWNPLGAAFEAGGVMSQGSSLIGVYGLSFVMATFTGLVAFGIQHRRNYLFAQNLSLRFGLILFLSLSFYGVERLSHSEAKGELVIRLVQPNIPQKIKWNEESFSKIVSAYISLSTAPSSTVKRPDIIIWPEGALPASAETLFAENSWTAPALNQMLSEGQFLIMGAYYSEYLPLKDRETWRNAMMILRKEGGLLTVEQPYAKFKLVPFGEYTPFEPILKKLGVQNLVNIGEGYSPGERTVVHAIKGIPPFLPLICYEGIFPQIEASGLWPKKSNIRPEWIVNISNDAWFGNNSGPKQHYNLSKYRAIEHGLPMVRSTPTGISALIDSRGRALKSEKLALNHAGFVDVILPRAEKITVFQQFGHIIVTLVSIFCLICFGFRPLLLADKKRLVFYNKIMPH
jgi:apolipoprotein N-acyltransferase